MACQVYWREISNSSRNRLRNLSGFVLPNSTVSLDTWPQAAEWPGPNQQEGSRPYVARSREADRPPLARDSGSWGPPVTTGRGARGPVSGPGRTSIGQPGELAKPRRPDALVRNRDVRRRLGRMTSR